MATRRFRAAVHSLTPASLLGGLRGLGVIAMLTVASVGCTNDVSAPQSPSHGGTASAGGTIEGRVTVHGPLPAVEPIRMGVDPTCVQVAGATPGNSDEVVVATDGAVANAFIYLKAGLESQYTYAVPTTPVVLDQRGCRFVPRVLGIRARQTLDIVNSDPTEHDIHGLPGPNGQFNHLQPVQGMRETHVFTVPQVMLRMKCDVHPWMSAFVGIVDHPFFALTESDGRFTLTGVPDGHYTVEMWHERFGTLTVEAVIADQQSARADFAIESK
jgi:hypothetical protein